MKKLFFLYLFVCFLSGCTRGDKQLLLRINQSIDKQQYNRAKLQIDSLNNLYATEIETRKIANKLFYQINLKESERNLGYFTTLLKVRETSLDSLMHFFQLEKDEKYQDQGAYIHKNTLTENNATNTYLKVRVKENGEMDLISIFCGNKDLVYSSIRVSTPDFFVASSAIAPDQTYNTTFSDENHYWRTIIFNEKAANGIVAFVSNYAEKAIKVSLIGRQNISYVLNKNDKYAIRDAYHLSAVLKDIELSKKSITQANKQIALLKQKIK